MTRILRYTVGQEEIEEFYAWVVADGDVCFIAECVDDLPFPRWHHPSEVADARSDAQVPRRGAPRLWNRAVSPTPRYRVSKAHDNVFGRDLYFLEHNQEVVEIGSRYGRLYTAELVGACEGFRRWYATLIAWFKQRCVYLRQSREWISAEGARTALARESSVCSDRLAEILRSRARTVFPEELIAELRGRLSDTGHR